LARRDLSVAEARVRLVEAGVPQRQIESSITEALRRRWLDDRRLAARVVEKMLARPVPPSLDRIDEQLARRQVEPKIRQEVLGTIEPAELERRLGDWLRENSGRTPLRTLYGRLVRAGHDPEKVAPLLERFESRSDDGA
jgi:SOS response regulatory protein OraA/RecX